jgi:hypothetical protein
MASSNAYVGSAVSPASAITKEYPVANGVTVNDGDFVYTTSGRVTNASIPGVTLLGMVVGQRSDRPDVHTETYSATGDSAGTVKVLVIVEPNAKYALVNDNIGTTFAASHVGTCFDLIGAAGAQLVDTSTTGTTGQLECIKFGYDGDNTKGLFIINEHKYKVNA